MDLELRVAKRKFDNQEIDTWEYLRLLKRGGFAAGLSEASLHHISNPATLNCMALGSGAHEAIVLAIVWLLQQQLATSALVVTPAALRDYLNDRFAAHGFECNSLWGKTRRVREGINIISFDSLTKPGTTGNPDIIFCNEAQYIKNANTTRFRKFIEFTKNCNPRWKIASSSCLLRNLSDLFGVCQFLDPQIFPTQADIGRSVFETINKIKHMILTSKTIKKEG